MGKYVLRVVSYAELFFKPKKKLLLQISVKNFPQFIPKIDAYYKHAENSRNIKNSSNPSWIHVVMRLKSVHHFPFIFLTITNINASYDLAQVISFMICGAKLFQTKLFLCCRST